MLSYEVVDELIEYLAASLENVVPEEDWDYIEELLYDFEERLTQHIKKLFEER